MCAAQASDLRAPSTVPTPGTNAADAPYSLDVYLQLGLSVPGHTTIKFASCLGKQRRSNPSRSSGPGNYELTRTPSGPSNSSESHSKLSPITVGLKVKGHQQAQVLFPVADHLPLHAG